LLPVEVSKFCSTAFHHHPLWLGEHHPQRETRLSKTNLCLYLRDPKDVVREWPQFLWLARLFCVVYLRTIRATKCFPILSLPTCQAGVLQF
jgi:hypothetical protein